MTAAQQGDIITAVKRSHWNPEIGMRMYASATSAGSFVSAIREVRAYI